MELDLLKKQEEFNNAMYRYENSFIFRNINVVFSILIVSLQIYTIPILINSWQGKSKFLLSFIIAYILADMIGGFAHLFTDTNDNYSNYITGPLIAAFHLHHKKPKYKNNNICTVYFNENGPKVWLLIFIIIFLIMKKKGKINNKMIITVCILFSFLSSFAEVSHYLCHNSNNVIVKKLQKYRILLDPYIHKIHHTQDNINYTFLNGCTDFIVNYFAIKYFNGYKNNIDLHYLKYKGQTSNR